MSWADATLIEFPAPLFDVSDVRPSPIRTRFGGFALSAWIYIGIVAVAGVGILVVQLPRELPDETSAAAMLFFFAACALLAELRPVNLPYSASISVSAAFYLATTLVFSAQWGTALAVFVSTVSDVLRGKRWYKNLFNATGAALWFGLPGLAYVALDLADTPHLGGVSLVGALAYASLYVLLNTSMISLVIGLTAEISPYQVLIANYRSIAFQVLAMIALGILLSMVYREASFFGVVLLLLPLVILDRSFRAAQSLRVGAQHTIEALADILEKRDPATFLHSRRVAYYAECMTRRMGLPLEELETIVLAARVHDLGKAAIPDNILAREMSLDIYEERLIQEHPALGANIVGQLPFYRKARQLILLHQERYDGSGYPLGYQGAQIPLGARIIAVADTFDAMISDRPYGQGLSWLEASRELEAMSGTSFDPQVVAVFLALLREPGGIPVPWSLAHSPIGRKAQEQVQPSDGVAASTPFDGTDFEASVRFYEENLPLLVERYEGKFVAILDNEIVDSADDFGELALRVYQRFGYRDIFMPKVERKPRTVRVPSPRLRA